MASELNVRSENNMLTIKNCKEVMKKLYDEIMALEAQKQNGYYDAGFEDGIEAAAELAKKYDDEIERLNKELKRLRSGDVFIHY